MASRNCTNIGTNFPDIDGKIDVPVGDSIHILISVRADRFLSQMFREFKQSATIVNVTVICNKDITKELIKQPRRECT